LRISLLYSLSLRSLRKANSILNKFSTLFSSALFPFHPSALYILPHLSPLCQFLFYELI
jgi:hypothetical protein